MYQVFLGSSDRCRMLKLIVEVEETPSDDSEAFLLCAYFFNANLSHGVWRNRMGTRKD